MSFPHRASVRNAAPPRTVFGHAWRGHRGAYCGGQCNPLFRDVGKASSRGRGAGSLSSAPRVNGRLGPGVPARTNGNARRRARRARTAVAKHPRCARTSCRRRQRRTRVASCRSAGGLVRAAHRARRDRTAANGCAAVERRGSRSRWPRDARAARNRRDVRATHLWRRPSVAIDSRCDRISEIDHCACCHCAGAGCRPPVALGFKWALALPTDRRTVTGTSAKRATAAATERPSNLRKPRLPRVPITIASIPFSRAYRAIILAVPPNPIVVLQSTPLSCSRSRAPFSTWRAAAIRARCSACTALLSRANSSCMTSRCTLRRWISDVHPRRARRPAYSIARFALFPSTGINVLCASDD